MTARRERNVLHQRQGNHLALGDPRLYARTRRAEHRGIEDGSRFRHRLCPRFGPAGRKAHGRRRPCVVLHARSQERAKQALAAVPGVETAIVGDLSADAGERTNIRNSLGRIT